MTFQITEKRKDEIEMEILRAENLTKIYGKGSTKVVALDHVSFSVEKGEFVAIVGASGSGKSAARKVQTAKYCSTNARG